MKLHIRLGPQRFAAEREGLSILGTVQRGLQIGALARNPEGEYLQVNGDITQPLNKSRVELALQKSGGIPKAKPVAGPPAVMPTVIVKPRRRIAMLPDGAASAGATPPANVPAQADLHTAAAPAPRPAAAVVAAAPTAEGRRPPLVLRRKIST